MRNKKHNNNIITTQQTDINEVGIINTDYSEYLNTIANTGQKDSVNEDHFDKQSNGIRQAVNIHYQKLRINVLTLFDEWQKKTNRAIRKLSALRIDINNVKAVNASLTHVRFFRGFLYALMGVLFFLGEVEFSKQTIIYAWQMGQISFWWQAALILALASTTGLCKLVYERFIEPYYDERDKNAHTAGIRKFYFVVTGLVVSLFLMVAYYRAIIAKIGLIEIIGNPYEILHKNHPYIMISVFVVVALLFLIGAAILLTVGLKELSNWYKIKKNKRLIDALLAEEKILESELDDCSNNLNKYRHTIEFMNNKQEFNDYIENEIRFFNTQYQRGIMNGVEKSDEDGKTLDAESNNQIKDELSPQGNLYEEIHLMDDFHLRVRRNLDKVAQLQ